MSLFGHIALFAILVLDLVLGATLVSRFLGNWAAIGFEFLIILGYILFVLQLMPWRDREGGD